MNRCVGLVVAFALLLSACSKKGAAPVAAAEESPSESAQRIAVISSQTAQVAGIGVAIAGPAEIRETLTLFGSIAPNAERRQEIRARYAGVVREVAKRPGEQAAKGELLLTIESNDSLEPYAIRSPIAGTVLERRVNAGETAEGTQTLMVVADLSTVWAEIAVFSRDLHRVRAGQTVLIQAADGERQTTARIAYVAPAGDTESQSVVARAVLENRRGEWVPGQFITGDIVVAQVNAPVTVAPIALQTFGGKTVVFVKNAKGFEPREIETGHRSKTTVEVIKGLTAGEHYAAENSYLIKSDLLKGTGEED